MFFVKDAAAQQNIKIFNWPQGKKAAISLTFDDARFSQSDTGTLFLDRYGVKATFLLFLLR